MRIACEACQILMYVCLHIREGKILNFLVRLGHHDDAIGFDDVLHALRR